MERFEQRFAEYCGRVLRCAAPKLMMLAAPTIESRGNDGVLTAAHGPEAPVKGGALARRDCDVGGVTAAALVATEA